MVSTESQAMVTFGDYDCGQWFTRKVVAQTWLLGYLSGLNVAYAKGDKDALDKANSADQIFLWMDNYCKAHPLEMVSAAGFVLYLELKAK